MKENKPQLEELIETWELELGSQKSLTEDNILELSSHLRDHVDELLERNLTEEEAFAIARYQLGEVGVIEEEFKKVDNRNNTLLLNHFLFGVVAFFLIYYSSYVINNLLLSGIVRFEVPRTDLVYYQVGLSLIINGLIGGLLFKGYKLIDLSRLINDWRLLFVMGLLMIPIYGLWTYSNIFLHYSFNTREQLMTIAPIFEVSFMFWLLLISICSVFISVKMKRTSQVDYV